jgi:carboxypeptidase family protein
MPEDRDQLFERALARHLRTAGAAESVCPNPDFLAAFHERTLSPEEMSYAKSHIISCARCQSVLAQLEATEAVNELPEDAQAGVQNLAAAGFAGQARQPVARAAKSSATAAPSKVVAIPPKKYFSLRWFAPAGAVAAGLLVWISFRESRINTKPSAPVPAAQVAENREQAAPSGDAENLKDLIQSEELEKQKSAASSTRRLNERTPIAQATPRPQPSLRDEKKDAAVGGKLESEDNKPSAGHEYSARAGTGMGGGRGPSAAAAQAQANNALQRSDQGVVAQMTDAAPADLDKAERRKVAPPAKSGIVGAAQPAAAPLPPPAPKRLSARLRGTVTDPSGAVVAGANVVLKSANGDTVVSTSTDTSGAYSFSGVAAGNYQLELQSAGFKTDRLTGLTVAAGENVMNARLELGTSTETVEVAAQAPVISNTSQVAEVSEARDLKARNLQTSVLLSPGLETVTSPDGNAVWKFGEAGQIFRSTNAGKDWTSAVSGVAVKLLAGSAPSAKICWVAGASGTLLRTTDGGKHWQRIAVPISGDLGGVRASDAKHASIWDAANRLSYETSDGGATWK